MRRFNFNIGFDAHGPYLYREDAEDGNYVYAEQAIDQMNQLRQTIDTLQDTLAEALAEQPNYDWRARAEHHVKAAQELLKSTS